MLPALLKTIHQDSNEEYETSFSFTVTTTTTTTTNNSTKEIKEFFDRHGYVVIDGILDAKEIVATVEEVERFLNDKKRNKKTEGEEFKILDVSTHHLMPATNRFAVLQSGPMFTLQFLKNRQNERLCQAFRILFGPNHPFVVTHDSGCLYRPTGNDPSYSTPDEWPHLDLHPEAYIEPNGVTAKAKRDALTYENPGDFLAENNLICQQDGLQLAALINLWPNRVCDGGFYCLPGFPSKFDEWVIGKKKEEKQKNINVGLYHFNKLNKDDAKIIGSFGPHRRIACRAGSVIIWDQKMAHGSKPNVSSDRCRIAQFIKAIPLHTMTVERRNNRREALKKIFKTMAAPNVSETGKHVFDFCQ